ncbi:MAG: hypothetical protein EOP38_31785 [Rubrivivax sp.]|nr:MAG: hypothetical protein EOP38_31785 [Rubrivivax sp.]
MRAIAAAVLALTISSHAMAAEAAGPLAAGKPAGVKQAAIETGGVVMWVGILAVAGGIAAIASTTQGNGSSSSTGTNP